MGNALAFLAAIAAVLWLGWWLRNRHPADHPYTPNHQEK